MPDVNPHTDGHYPVFESSVDWQTHKPSFSVIDPKNPAENFGSFATHQAAVDAWNKKYPANTVVASGGTK